MIKEVNPEEFKQLYFEMTTLKLADHYGVKENQIIKIAKQLGISKRKPSTTLVLKQDWFFWHNPMIFSS